MAANFVEVPLRVLRLVEEAVVAKKAVEVAFERVTSLLKVLVPVHVLLVESRDEPVERHVPLMEKQPEVRLMPFAKVDEAVVEVTMRIPVVVAEPLMVRPVVVDPPPIVEEAEEMKLDRKSVV